MRNIANNTHSAEDRSGVYAAFASAFRGKIAETDVVNALELPPLKDEEKETAFISSFEPAVSKQACSLFEGAHVTRERNAVFEDLVRFYDFFGLTRNISAELPDHLSIELEFMHFLTFLEHEAASRKDDITGLRAAQKDFLARHLVPFSKGVHEGNGSHSPTIQTLTARLKDFVLADDEYLAETAN